MSVQSPNRASPTLYDELNIIEDQPELGTQLSTTAESVFFSGVIEEIKLGKSVTRLVLITNKRFCYLKRGFSCSWLCLVGLPAARAKLLVESQILVSEFMDLTINSKRFSVVLHLRKSDDLLLSLTSGKDVEAYSNSNAEPQAPPVTSVQSAPKTSAAQAESGRGLKSTLHLTIEDEDSDLVNNNNNPQHQNKVVQMSETLRQTHLADKYRSLITALNQVYYLTYSECICIYQVVGAD